MRRGARRAAGLLAFAYGLGTAAGDGLRGRPRLQRIDEHCLSVGAAWRQITPEECVNLATIANGLPGTVSGEGARPILIAGVKYIFLGTSRERENDVFYIRQVWCVFHFHRVARAA